MKLKKNLLLIIETLDIFSYQFSYLLTFQGKFRYSTLYTKMMTFFVCLITFGSFFYFASNYIYRKHPQSILTEEFNINPRDVKMAPESFIFNFALENYTTYKPFIDESIYKVEAKIETKINEEMTYSQISVGRCKEELIPSSNDLKQYFIQSHYENLYCFQNYSETIMSGTWDSPIFNNIRIEIRACNNKTDNNTCKSQEIIDDMLESAYLVMHYTTVKTDANNFENPLKVYAVDDFQKTSLKIASHIYLYFGNVKVETDLGGFQGDNYVYHEGISQTSSKFSQFQNLLNDNFLTIFLRLDTITKKTNRKYDNVLDVLSKIGGLIRILTVFAALILKPFLEASTLQRVSNETFDYRDMIRTETEIGKSPTSFNKKIKLSLWEFMKSKFKKKVNLTKKEKIIRKCVKMMKENLDVSSLINKMFDLEKIKLIVNKKEFDDFMSQKPRIIVDKQIYKELNLKSDFEKEFQKNFCITDSKIFMQESNRSPPIKKKSFGKKDSANEKHLPNKDILVEQNCLYIIKEKASKSEECSEEKISEEALGNEAHITKNPSLLKKKFKTEI